MPASYLEQDEDHTVEGFNEFAHMTVSTEGTIVLSMKTEGCIGLLTQQKRVMGFKRASSSTVPIARVPF